MITNRRFAFRDGEVVEITNPLVVPSDPWPKHESVALAVLPSQKQDAEAESVAMGVPTEFRRMEFDCVPVFTSRKHWKRYCEAGGHFAKNASYGDPQPK